MKDSPLIFPSLGSESMVQLNDKLLDLFHNTLMVPGSKIGSWFCLCSAIHLYSLPEPNRDCQVRLSMKNFRSGQVG